MCSVCDVLCAGALPSCSRLRLRVLTVADPNSASNLVAYSYKEREFKTIPPGPLDNIVFHFSMDGSSLHVVRTGLHVLIMPPPPPLALFLYSSHSMLQCVAHMCCTLYAPSPPPVPWLGCDWTACRRATRPRHRASGSTSSDGSWRRSGERPRLQTVRARAENHSQQTHTDTRARTPMTTQTFARTDSQIHRRMCTPSRARLTLPCDLPRPLMFSYAATDDDGAGDPSGGKNQFNYSERAAQTYNAVMKVGVFS